MTQYDVDFIPPAPTTFAAITHPSEESSIEQIKMQLDSAADMTCVPQHVLSNIPNLSYSSVKVKGYDGSVSTRTTYFVRLSLDGRELGIIEAIPIGGDIGLIGRDVLNDFVITLDGPKSQWSW